MASARHLLRLGGRALFATVRSAREKINIPERFVRLNNYTMVSPDEVEDAFIAANPGLAHDMIAVTCSRRYLSEVRICMGKDLAFMPARNRPARLPQSADRDAARTRRLMNYRHAFHAGNFAMS